MKHTKTLEDWNQSGKTLSEYLQPGDTVDEDLYCEMRDCVPPITLKDGLMQVGEPYTHINKPTYATFTRSGDTYTYCGHCYEGETKDPTYPSYSFSGDPNTDAFSVGANSYGIAINGKRAAMFDISNIDWRELTTQKRALERSADAENMTGILGLIDAMQDEAGPLVGDACKLPITMVDAVGVVSKDWYEGFTVTQVDKETGTVWGTHAVHGESFAPFQEWWENQ